MTNMTTGGLCGAAKYLAIGSVALAAGATAWADSFTDVIDGLKEDSKVSLNIRARFEYVDVEGADKIEAYGLRTRLGWTTGEYNGFKAMVEMEDLRFDNDNERPGLDVPTTEVNQIWVSHSGAKLGRQIYVLDDQRFIGHVGWRQNIQTFDALTVGLTPEDGPKLSFAYLDAVHRINATSQDLDGFVANGSYKVSDTLTLTAFAYLLDFDRPALASSDTFGIRGTGSFKVEEIKYSYMFSFAQQGDNSGSSVDFSHQYLAGEFGAAMNGFSLLGGIEILEGDGTSGFTTPLATVHKFNGFADQFAGRSLGLGGGLPQGLEDLYVTFGFKAGPVPVKVTYHSFSTENVSDHLGSEIDLVASYKLNDYVTLVGKYANYSANDSNSVAYGGQDKVLTTLEANFKF